MIDPTTNCHATFSLYPYLLGHFSMRQAKLSVKSRAIRLSHQLSFFYNKRENIINGA